ncbi:MAG: hypothetical protein IJG37_00980 [Synergistaceae bacterium]|nr:hypothetical protein [Synergistaceae bacterium]MBR0184502.1 hypothetical protein [Synergistaceae bacterium]
MIILRHGRYISGTRIFRAGEVLPDTPGVQELVDKRLAEAVAEVKTQKAAKKREAPVAQENVKVDT